MRKVHFLSRHSQLSTSFLIQRKKIRLGIIICVFIVLLSFGIGKLTKIKTINVVGVPAKIEIDSETISRNLLFFPVEKVRKKLLEEYPQFSDIKIHKRYPQTLEVELIAREPIAVVQTSGRRVLVDKEGMIIGDTDNNEKPIIDLPNFQIKGTKIDHPAVKASLAFLAGMAQYDDIKRIIVEHGTLRVQTSAMTYIMTEKRDGSESARTLQSLLTGFRIRGTLPKIIDLRFEQPVVTW